MPTSEYRSVPLAQLHESTFNPRRTFTDESLAGLAASIQAQGVLQPLLVRPSLDQDDKFEIVAGARRFRAATLADADTVPVRIVSLTDAQALEAAVVENLQRVDVHPLEEALGFRALMAMPDSIYDVALIAEKTGKSKGYITQRLKLCDLIPEAQAEFMADRIFIGHAFILARLTEANQLKALPACWVLEWRAAKSGEQELETSAGDDFDDSYTGDDGDSDDEEVDEDEEAEEKQPAQRPVMGHFPNKNRPVPVRDFQNWCSNQFLLVLESAVFDTHDETLVPAAGSCDTCPKRTGNNSLLFAEIPADSCTDPACYALKVAAHLDRAVNLRGLMPISSGWNQSEEAKAKGWPCSTHYTVLTPGAKAESAWEQRQFDDSHADQACPDMVKAVIVEGRDDVGEVVTICASVTCKLHRKAREASLRGNTSPFGSETDVKERRAKEILEGKVRIAAELEVVRQVVEEVPAGAKAGAQELRFIARSCVKRLQWNQIDSLAERLGCKAKGDKQDREVTKANLNDHIDQLPVAELPALIVLIVLWADVGGYTRSVTEDACAVYGVDPKVVEKAVRKDLVAQAKAKAVAKAAKTKAA